VAPATPLAGRTATTRRPSNGSPDSPSTVFVYSMCRKLPTDLGRTRETDTMIKVGGLTLEIRTPNTGGLFLIVSDAKGRGFGTSVTISDLYRLGKFLLRESRKRTTKPVQPDSVQKPVHQPVDVVMHL
jgi:hypothetical protein